MHCHAGDHRSGRDGAAGCVGTACGSRHSAGAETEYRFKHALTQDAAYENLLKSRRQILHRRAAEALRDLAAATTEPELLAHHFSQAGLTEAAIEWWDKAGPSSAYAGILLRR